MAVEGEPAGGNGGSPPPRAESVQVAVRVRPMDPGLAEEGEASSLEVIPGSGIELEAIGAGPGVNGNSPAAGAVRKRVSCSYDQVFGPEASQEEVFGFVDGVRRRGGGALGWDRASHHLIPRRAPTAVVPPQVVPALLEGINCTLFTYGQTGSGKTHTLLGDQFETRIVEEEGSEEMAADPGRCAHALAAGAAGCGAGA